MADRALAISTGSFHPTPTREAIVRIASLGFKQVEVTVQDAELNYDFHRRIAKNFFEELAHLVHDSGLQVVSLHSPPMSSVQAFSSKARSDIMTRTLEIAARLRADELVVHPYHIFKSYEDSCRFFSDESLKIMDFVLPDLPSLVNKAEEHGIQIAIENIAHWADHPLLNEPSNMLRLVHALDSDSVGVDLDIFHSEFGGKTSEFLEKLRNHILSVHLSDYSDSRNRVLPGKGNVGWAELARKVRILPNANHIVLEVAGQFDDGELPGSASYLRRVFGLEL